MGAQEQRFFLITATLWEPSSKADRGARHPADSQLRSSQGDRRSGKDVYTSLKITSPCFAAELSINIRTAIPQICISNVRLSVAMCRLQDSVHYIHT